MFKELLSGINKFFNRKEFVLIVIIVLVAFALLSYTKSKTIILDGMSESDEIVPYTPADSYYSGAGQVSENMEEYGASEEEAMTNSFTPTSNSFTPTSNSSNASELLPNDKNSDWAQLNAPVSAGMTPNLLQAGYHIGLDTVGQTMRNANLQLRSDPIIPKQEVGPWMQSTIEPDLGRVPLEIGATSQ
jgi:hypothetical protein